MGGPCSYRACLVTEKPTYPLSGQLASCHFALYADWATGPLPLGYHSAYPLFARGADLAPTGPCPCNREAGSSARWTARLVPLFTACWWYQWLAHPRYNSSAYPCRMRWPPSYGPCTVIRGLPIRLVESSPRAAWHYKPSEPRSPSSRPQWYLASTASPSPAHQGCGHSSPWSAGLALCHPQQCAISALEPQSPPEAAMSPLRHWVMHWPRIPSLLPPHPPCQRTKAALELSCPEINPHAASPCHMHFHLLPWNLGSTMP